MGLVYRTDIVNDRAFQQYYEQQTGKKFAFPPADFPTFVEMAKAADDFTPENVYGVAMQGAKIDPIVMELFNYLVAVGGDIYNRQMWAATMNTPQGIQALTHYKDLLENAAQPGASGANFDDAFNVFGQGNAVFAVTYNFLMSWLLDPKNSKVADKVDFAALPGGGLLGGWAWAIPKSTAHPDEAWQFIKWVEKKENQKARGMAGGMPTVKWVYQDPEFLQKWPFQKTAYQAIATDKPVPVVSQSTRMIEIVGEYASQAMAGDLTIEEAVRRMDAELNEIIQNDPLIEMQK
jgi:ABC-type glycerol-3-phosphate transport system substrate-binding protein